jgi:hypothetical protein
MQYETAQIFMSPADTAHQANKRRTAECRAPKTGKK